MARTQKQNTHPAHQARRQPRRQVLVHDVLGRRRRVRPEAVASSAKAVVARLQQRREPALIGLWGLCVGGLLLAAEQHARRSTHNEKPPKPHNALLGQSARQAARCCCVSNVTNAALSANVRLPCAWRSTSPTSAASCASVRSASRFRDLVGEEAPFFVGVRVCVRVEKQLVVRCVH